MHLNATPNQYLPPIARIYDKIPKAVFAAIAVSALTTGGDFLDEATGRVLREWQTLYENGIVPQKPPAKFRDLMAEHGV